MLASGDVYLKKVRFEGPSQARPSQAEPEETIMIVRQVPRGDAPEAKAPCWLFSQVSHMMPPGLFLQREEPGSEPGNSLVHPDGHM